jgi:hypothetical protein
VSDEPNEPDADQPDPDEPEIGEPGNDGRYPAEIVQNLRREAADRRRKARDADEARTAAEQRATQLSERLIATTVAQHATTLADPADLLAHVDTADLTDDDGMPDPAKITIAAAGLLAKKPHLASRKPSGDIDQGARGDAPEAVDFAGLLRGAAR